MTHFRDLDKLMSLINDKYRAYKDDVRFHANWKGEESNIEKSKSELVSALYNLTAELLPNPSNVRDLGELRIYSPVALDDLEGFIKSANLPCDHSNSN